MTGHVTAVTQDEHASPIGSAATDSLLALLIVDRQSKIVHVNLWSPELPGAPLALLNRPLDEVLCRANQAECERATCRTPLHDALLAEDGNDLELLFHADKRKVPVRVSSSRIVTDNAGTTGANGAANADSAVEPLTLITLRRADAPRPRADALRPREEAAALPPHREVPTREVSTLPGENVLLFLLGARWLSLLPPFLVLALKPSYHPQALGSLAVAVFVVAVLHNLFLTSFHSRLNALVLRMPALMGIDMLITAAFIAATGGINSPYEIYSYTPLLASAFFFRIRGGLIAATIFMFFYFVALSISHYLVGFTDIHEVIAQILSYYLAAIVFGYPSHLLQRLHAATRQLESIQQHMVRTESLASIGRMAAHVSHEIRNPLSTVGGFATRIEQHPEDTTRVRRNAHIIVDEVRRLEELLNDMLDMARQPSLCRQPASLHEILDKACLLSDGLMNPQTPVIIRKEYDPHLPPVECDAATLLRAFLNVIRNAIQAMPEGGTVFITTKREGDSATISITDSGPGIRPDLLPTLFQPFVSHRSNGTGLGLAVAQSVIKQHEGSLEAENVPGSGARFTFHLPLKAPAATE